MQTDLSLIQSRADEPGRRARLRYGAAGEKAPTNARRPPFDGLTICLHWVSAFIVLAMFASAWLHALAEGQDSVFTAGLLQTHRSLGVTIWAMTALRLAWRLTNAKLPPFPANTTKPHRVVVQASEYGLYALLLFQPATGLCATLFSGRSFALFLWQIPQLMPQDKALGGAFHSMHELGAWALAALAAGHAAAALIHHFVLRDDVLMCMAPAITATRGERLLSSGHVIGGRSVEVR